MQITLERAASNDAPQLLEMQKVCFAPLLERYHDHDISPCCETEERVRFKVENSFYYFILADGKRAGAIRVVDNKDGSRKRISPLYVLPEFRNKGVAQAAIKECERLHGESNWSLDTILEEKGNCYLYEKMGYEKTGKFEKISEIQTIVFYIKD